MAQQERNVTNLIINNRVAALSAGAVDALNVGEVGVFSADGVRITTASAPAVTEFFLARGSATPAADGYYKTDLISVADIVASSVSVTGVAGTNLAATEQQDSIGYNGTSGSIEAINNNLYLVSIYVQEYLTSSTDGRKIKHFQYHSDATATQAEIAIGLTGSAINNWSKEAEQYIVFKALCDNAGAATTGTGTYSITRGSKTLLAGTAIDAVLSVGDFIRLDESAGGAPAVTDAVYRIESMDTTTETATLDRAYQSASLSAVAEANGVFITAALGAAGDWGVDLLGQPLDFIVGKLFYKKTRWESSLKNFGTTNSAREGNATKGQIDGEDLVQTEWFLAGNEGEYYRMGEPAIYPNTLIGVNTEHYGSYSISFRDTSLVGFTDNISPKLLLIAIPNDAGAGSGNTPANAITATGNSLSEVLDTILGTSSAFIA